MFRETGFCHTRLPSPHMQIFFQCCLCLSCQPIHQAQAILCSFSLSIHTQTPQVIVIFHLWPPYVFCFGVHFLQTGLFYSSSLVFWIQDALSFISALPDIFLVRRHNHIGSLLKYSHWLVVYFLLHKIKGSSFTWPFEMMIIHPSTVMVLPSVSPSRCQPFFKHSMLVET